MEIKDFLNWLLAGGGVTIAGSWIAERVPQFQALEPDKKEYVFFGFVSLAWIVTYLFLNYVPTSFIDSIAPFFLGVSGLFISIVVGKMFHKADKAP